MSTRAMSNESRFQKKALTMSNSECKQWKKSNAARVVIIQRLNHALEIQSRRRWRQPPKFCGSKYHHYYISMSLARMIGVTPVICISLSTLCTYCKTIIPSIQTKRLALLKHRVLKHPQHYCHMPSCLPPRS